MKSFKHKLWVKNCPWTVGWRYIELWFKDNIRVIVYKQDFQNEISEGGYDKRAQLHLCSSASPVFSDLS